MEIGVLLSLVGIFILILLGAFFSASETALTAASKARMHARAKAGSSRAALVNKIRKKKDRMIGAMLLGNNFVNTLGAALATGLLIKAFGEAGIFYATLVMTILILVFAEVLPKTYAVHHAERFALRYVYIIDFCIRLFYPVTQAVSLIVRMALKIFGIDIAKASAGSQMELLRGVIDMHRDSNEETQQQRVMLRSILDLFEATVADIMVPRQNAFMIDGDRPAQEIVSEVLENAYSRLPVWRERPDNIIGIIQARLLLKALSDNNGDASGINLDSAMLEPWFIPDTTSLHDQLQAFRERKEHFAIVVDEYGTFMGIVTLEDILEEIVGEIDDEVDENVPGVKRGKGGSYLVDGSVTVRELNREFEWQLPDQYYSTAAGLVLYESETIPEIGQKFHFHGLKFEIMKRERNRITRLRITPPKKLKKSAA
ncbi:MAG: HlyC/CorC family transporter [Alphaproteobacteria bacterium]